MKISHNFLILPKNKISISETLKSGGRSEEETKKTIDVTGIISIHSAHNKSLTGLVHKGIEIISATHSNAFDGIDAIIAVSQTYDTRIPSLSTRIQALLNLPSTTYCIDVMDGCSGFIKSLSIADMLAQNRYKKIMIIAGDINSLITANAEIGTKILFGDGISLTILEADENTIDVLLYNKGDKEKVISCSANDNILNMNGFEVFRFTKNFVPNLINEYLTRKGISLENFDLIALHQASKLVVSTISNSLKINNKLTENFNCEKIGNIGAGSIGAWLANIKGLVELGRQNMLAVGYGSGLSWGLASIMIEVTINEVIYVDY